MTMSSLGLIDKVSLAKHVWSGKLDAVIKTAERNVRPALSNAGRHILVNIPPNQRFERSQLGAIANALTDTGFTSVSHYRARFQVDE
jgi:hypothetical protein